MSIEQEKMIVEALPSLYPLKDYEEDAIHAVIDALPPAQPEPLQPWEVLAAQAVLSHPEPHWIPVEQELPTEDDDYLCTFGAETGWFVDWCSWYEGRWVWWNDDVPNPVSNVIAWCYPIEPYKGVTIPPECEGDCGWCKPSVIEKCKGVTE